MERSSQWPALIKRICLGEPHMHVLSEVLRRARVREEGYHMSG